MSSEVATQADLIPSQRKAAYLHSQGMKSRDIAELIGVAPSTITSWSKLAAFQAESTRWLEMSTGRIDALFSTVRGEYLEGAIEAIESARAGLQAVTLDGEPRWDVRMRCQEILLKHLTLRDQEVGSGQAASSAAVVIHFGNEGADRNDVSIAGVKVDADSGRIPNVVIDDNGEAHVRHRKK